MVNTSLYKKTTSHYSPSLAKKKSQPTDCRDGGTILLNYNFKMEYLPMKKFDNAEGLSRLIPKYKEPLEDTVIASLQSEEIKNYSL